MTVQQAIDLAISHHQAGRLPEAENLYRAVVEEYPNNADAHHLLGILAYQSGNYNVALEFILRAVFLSPNVPQYHGNLGLVLAAQGRTGDAIAAYRRGIAQGSKFAELPYNLANALYEQGKLDEAILEYKNALELRPDYPEALNNLGNPYSTKGDYDTAINYFRRAILLRPNYPEAHNNLGTALYNQGKYPESVESYRASIAQRPDYADAYNNIGQALYRAGNTQESINALAKAISLVPKFAEAYNNLGNVLKEIGRPDEAIECYERAIAARPNFQFAYNNLGVAFKDRGELDRSIDCFNRALALDSQYASAHSNLIYTMHYHPKYDVPAIRCELDKWNQFHAAPLAASILPHRNTPDPRRPLRIGYVSADFREHVVGWNLLPLLSNHNHEQFEIVCYSTTLQPDAMTEKLRAHADSWRHLVGVSPPEMAEMIRKDRVDILVDLALHTAQNRLLVFARKPAPVQITYLGYCGSTGLDAIEYRFSDPHLDPPGADSDYSEKTIRLPNTYWSYQPGGATPEVNALPATKNGYITFGCFSNTAKVSEDSLALWTKILTATPSARLIITTQLGAHQTRVQSHFVQAGIAANRIELIPKQRFDHYIQTYLRIDIALDPFPYGGGITTCDALYMGVPVISLIGKTAVGRGGKSILTNLNMREFLADSQEQYLKIAVDQSADMERLSALRATLRQKMLDSNLMNAPANTKEIEKAYRTLWQTWCAKQTNAK
ncbi:MAG: tetratricopeptide repeat protein [Planctomycetota bacterium]|nr:tetratricopeptide repeat protein [Planctomycetota bacterium]